MDKTVIWSVHAGGVWLHWWWHEVYVTMSQIIYNAVSYYNRKSMWYALFFIFVVWPILSLSLSLLPFTIRPMCFANNFLFAPRKVNQRELITFFVFPWAFALSWQLQSNSRFACSNPKRTFSSTLFFKQIFTQLRVVQSLVHTYINTMALPLSA